MLGAASDSQGVRLRAPRCLATAGRWPQDSVVKRSTVIAPVGDSSRSDAQAMVGLRLSAGWLLLIRRTVLPRRPTIRLNRATRC